jgi:hypothetical protein
MTLQDYELARDLRAAIARNESPASPAGRAGCLRVTVERFTEGDAEMKSAMTGMVAGWGQWTSGPLTIKMRDFFLEAMKQDGTNS